MQTNPFRKPSPTELQTFSLGKLEAQRAAEIESFLAQHPDCSAILDAAPDDDIVGHLRGAGDLSASNPGHPEPTTLSWGERRGDTVSARDAAPAAEPSEDSAAALVDHPRYRLLQKLGEGGMGAVFLAEHRLMHRSVALKVIRTACLSHPLAVERFRREVRAAARLSHPNIVTAHDAEEAGGVHFLVMEYVEGVPLSAWLDQHGPLPAAEACGYVRQAALGLQYAHEKGMVHRDLKPPNLMRTPDGTVKILDFGLARFAHEGDRSVQTQLTTEGIVMGTPDYMAPEQAQDSRGADIRADIYSLGCTLHHLLAGRVPFPDGSVVDKLIRHATAPSERLAKLRPDLPAGLVPVVERLMAKAPADRYQTPAEVAEALAPFSGAARTRPAPPSPRRRWWIAAGLLGMLVLAAGAAVIITMKTPNQTAAPAIRGKGASWIAEKGVVDYAEIHDADEKRFDEWIARMKKDGYRPVKLTMQTVDDAPCYTAVAIQEKTPRGWEFTRIPNEDDEHIDQMWEKQFAAITMSHYYHKGELWEAYLWIDKAPQNNGIWTGGETFIKKKIEQARKRDRRPIYRCAIDTGESIRYGIVLDYQSSPPGTEAIDQTLAECQAWLEKQKTLGWRPECLHACGSGAKTRFGSLVVHDPPGPDWDASWSLKKAEFEQELSARKRQGFRPLTAAGHTDEGGSQRFSVIWIRYAEPTEP